MFSIAMAFLLFAGTALRLQGTVIQNTLKLSLGSDLVVQIFTNDRVGLREKNLREYVETYK